MSSRRISKRTDVELWADIAGNVQNLTKLDVMAVREKFLKDFTAKPMRKTRTFANLPNRVEDIDDIIAKKNSTSDSVIAQQYIFLTKAYKWIATSLLPKD